MAQPDAPLDMASYWTVEAGPAWVAEQERLDAQLGRFGERVLAALAPKPGERVLDVGCGTGALTLDLAAAVGRDGSVTAVDVAAPMLARARERAQRIGLNDRIHFREADAGAWAFEAGSFDAFASRFGVMFFTDPAAAFGNLAAALRPGGRLAFCCWQPRERNPWFMVGVPETRHLLEFPPAAPSGAPGPFGLCEPERVRQLLAGAGLDRIELAALEWPLRFAGSRDEIVEHLMTVGPIGGAARALAGDTDRLARVRGALAGALDGIAVDGGYEAAAAAWLVSARRP